MIGSPSENLRTMNAVSLNRVGPKGENFYFYGTTETLRLGIVLRYQGRDLQRAVERGPSFIYSGWATYLFAIKAPSGGGRKKQRADETPEQVISWLLELMEDVQRSMVPKYLASICCCGETGVLGYREMLELEVYMEPIFRIIHRMVADDKDQVVSIF